MASTFTRVLYCWWQQDKLASHLLTVHTEFHKPRTAAVQNIAGWNLMVRRTNTVVLEKLIVAELVNKLLALPGARWFVIKLTRTAKWPSLIQTQMYWINTLIPHFCNIHLNTDLSSTSWGSKWPCCFRCPYSLHSLACYMTSPFHTLNNIWGSSIPSYISPLMSEYSPQHPVLRHTQFTLFPLRERFIQNYKKNCIFGYFHTYAFIYQLKRQTFVNWMLARIALI